MLCYSGENCLDCGSLLKFTTNKPASVTVNWFIRDTSSCKSLHKEKLPESLPLLILYTQECIFLWTKSCKILLQSSNKEHHLHVFIYLCLHGHVSHFLADGYDVVSRIFVSTKSYGLQPLCSLWKYFP